MRSCLLTAPLIAAIVCCAVCLGFAQSGQPIPAHNAAMPAGYVGDGACRRCHETESESYKLTAHHLTSQSPSARSILGSFDSGNNTLLIASGGAGPDDPRLFFTMQQTDGRFFETAVAELGSKRLTHTEPIGIVVGSGVRGQTYLYWKENQLFELPVSYWTDGHQWINSPGYKDGTANFERHVDPRCIECHATYIHALSSDPQTNVYDPATLKLGISCETCHGPGAAHVALESQAPAKKSNASAIINPARLSRDRQVDGCALCHNGTLRRQLEPAFSYLPGQPLETYLAPDPMEAAAAPDVHGNQVALLKRSLCYRSSPSMSCATCHNVHAPEKDPASYSSNCLQCHEWQSCGASKRLGEAVKRDCIRCHMPLQPTASIVSVTAGREIRAEIRTHWIRVYPDTMPH